MLEKVLELPLSCKTPIWTGGLDKGRGPEMIKETGLLGSLRWWTEAVLRCMGYYVCEPTSTSQDNGGRCPRELNKCPHYCAGCAIFGATGRKRSFRLEVDYPKQQQGINVEYLRIKPEGRTHGWYLYPAVTSDFTLKIMPLRSCFDPVLLLLPFSIAAGWGAIGGKMRLGYGVVEIKENFGREVTIEHFQRAIRELFEATGHWIENHPNRAGLPNLKNMFFARIQFTADKGSLLKNEDLPRETDAWLNKFSLSSLPLTPLVKNWLRFGDGRQLWLPPEPCNEKAIEKWLFGFIAGENRQAGKINVSWVYPLGKDEWELRLWGWLPGDGTAPDGFNRRYFLAKLQSHLESPKSKGKTLLGIIPPDSIKQIEWRVYKPGQSEENFLRSLISADGKEEG